MKVSFVCMAKIFLSVKKRHPLKHKASKKKNYNNVYNNNLFKKKSSKETKKKTQTEPKSNIVP